MSNSKLSPLNIKKHPVSPRCYGFWPGMQDATDGNTTILDKSGNGRNLTIGANGTYAAVTATSKYSSIVGSANSQDKALTNAEVIQYDIAAGQSIILAFTINTDVPGAQCTICGFRGATGDIKGVAVKVDAAGKPIVSVRDTGITFNTTVPTDVITDSTDRVIVVAIDGTGKKIWGWNNGTLWSNMASGISGFGSGSTQPDGPLVFGGDGEFSAAGVPTWVTGHTLKIRNMAIYKMTSWPTNIAGIVSELTRNPHRPLSSFILP